jgi:signal transduction histidine kinase
MPMARKRPPPGAVSTLALAVSAGAALLVGIGAVGPQAAWAGLAAILVAAAASARAARRARETERLRSRADAQRSALNARLAQYEDRTVRLVQDILPGAVHLLRKGASVESVLSGVQIDPGLPLSAETAHGELLRSVLDTVKAEEDLRAYAQRAFVNIARRVQAIVHQQLQDLRDMENRHGADPDVFGDLLHLDHGTALIGRLADSLVVLGGSQPGPQRRQDVPLFSVLRGAMSRIIDYRRVEIHSVAEVSIVGPVVEPLIHALAELLDNATRYSPPDTLVTLTAVDAQAGIVIEVEDAGMGLSRSAAARAERLLAQVTTGLDLADMGQQTPRLGMSVVGRLAQSNGFSVSLRTATSGGVRAVLYLPRELVGGPVAPAAGTVGAGAAASDPTAPAHGSPAVEPEAGFLPQRRSRLTGRHGAPGPAPGRASLNGQAALNGTGFRGHAPHHGRRSRPPEPADTPAVEPGLWLTAFLGEGSGAPAAPDTPGAPGIPGAPDGPGPLDGPPGYGPPHQHTFGNPADAAPPGGAGPIPRKDDDLP